MLYWKAIGRNTLNLPARAIRYPKGRNVTGFRAQPSYGIFNLRREVLVGYYVGEGIMSQSGFLLIADISGYTEFIQLHNMRKRPIVGDKMADMFESHAEVIISDLLETVIDAIEPKMQLNKLEGDAAFFFCDVTDDKNQSDEIIELMDAANEAFKAKLTELVFVQACGCDPCRQSKNLRLKIVAHKGEFTVQKIRRFEELAGEDVVLVHRLLKNDLKSDEYWLVTPEFYAGLNAENQSLFAKVSQKLENFGTVKLNYLEFSTPEPRNEKVESRSRTFNWFVQAGYFSRMLIKRGLRGKSRGA